MNTNTLFLVTVLIGLLVYPLGFEITQRIAIRKGQIPRRGITEQGGMKFLHWQNFNAHKFGDTTGMVPLIAFVVMACGQANWTPLMSWIAKAIVALSIACSYLWVRNTRHAMLRGKFAVGTKHARRDWGFAGPDAKVTVAGWYNAVVSVPRFATVGIGIELALSGQASGSLMLCMLLSFLVWLIAAIVDTRTVNLVSGSVFLWAIILAGLEMCIEGKIGWGLGAPTWRTMNPVYSMLMNGKELTGYHAFMFVLPLLLLHLPLFFGRVWGEIKWTLAKELEIIAIYFVMCLTWDFAWFVINPEFTIGRFRPGEIWWHANWLGPIPNDHLGGIALALALTAFGAWRFDRSIVKRMGTVFSTFALGLALVVQFAPIYHDWYQGMTRDHGGLTVDWNKYLNPEKRSELERLLAERRLNEERIAELTRERAQEQQLGKK